MVWSGFFQGKWFHNKDMAKLDSKESPMTKQQAQQKLKNALMLLTDRPDGVADISACFLEKIPKDFFQLCAAYVKTTVLCSDNLLTSLEDGGPIGVLYRIKRIDCQRNQLLKLPLLFGTQFPALEDLNVSDNRLTTLPTSLGNLPLLKKLSIAQNKFLEFPDIICTLKSLVDLDISGNRITHLPLGLRNLVILQNIVLDVETIVYPPKEVCELGSAAVLRRIRESAGTEYVTNAAPDVVPYLPSFSPSIETVARYKDEESRMQNAISRYKSDEAHHTNDLLRFQKMAEDDERRHAESVHKGKVLEQTMLLRSLQERDEIEGKLQKLALNAEMGQKHLLDMLRDLEPKTSQHLVNYLAKLNKERAAQIKAYEDEAKSDDVSWKILNTEMEVVKRDQTLAAMKSQLEDAQKFDAFFKHLMEIAKMDINNVVNSHRNEEHRYVPLIMRAKMESENIVNALLCNEQVQREMFRELQLKMDAVHLRIMNDLGLLEKELATLSLLEQQQTEERSVIVKKSLEDERLKLAKLYRRLLEEKKQRELQLYALLFDMEKEAHKHTENFWLLQYSQLMEAMPTSLLEPAPQELKAAPSTSRHSSKSHVPVTSSEPVPSTSAGHKPVSLQTSVPSVFHMEAVCIICMERQSTEIFLPCGHICSCKSCSGQLEICPLCRMDISQTLTLHKSPED